MLPFSPPALERTYGNITRRQLIREAVETKDDGEGCSAAAVVNWIASEGSRRYPGLLGDDKKGQAEAWLLDELAAEDSRNSLDGLGVIRIEPTLVYDELKNPKVISVVDRAISSIPESNRKGITPDDFVLILKASLEYLRGRNAIKVPEGIDSLRVNHEKRGNWIVVGGPERRGEKDTILFAGSGTNSPENAFGAFARKYMLQVHGVSLNREDSQALLQAMFKFLSQFLGTYCERLGEKYLDGQKDRFRLNKSLWTLYRHGDDDLVYRCDTCGCETHLDTKGVCTTYKCNGRMMPITFAEAHDKDRFYKDVYQDEALPLEIEEHTAQLSSEKAREIQSRFIKGDVNVLSCTTTFELGVDVGDLRAIFMRNVPPSTANYTQRAGRVGRRAGMPGYAITFARLRPHDIAYYADPGRMISGRTRVPSCYLNNSAIAIRHVFAVAMSEFFRFAGSKHDIDYSHHYNDFMDLGKEFPCGLNELRDYLESRPEVIAQQVDQVLPPSEQAPSMEEIGDWRWVEELTRPEDPAGEGNPGRLVRTHALKNDDYARINEGIEANMDTNDSLASSLVRTRDALKKELTISVLAESGILPKYGFPTDLVDLHLPEMNSSIASNRLSLSRGMRQAIREYAPGSEIVAGKTLWKSIGIKRPRGRQLETRNYGRCPSCKTFVWPIENFDSVMECPVCGEEIHLEKRMLIPSYGFEGKKSNKGIGLRKPRSRGFSRVYFSQHWPNETSESVSYFAGGAVSLRYAGNGQL